LEFKKKKIIIIEQGYEDEEVRNGGLVFVVLCMVIFGIVPFLAIRAAYQKDYPGRKEVEKAIEEKRRKRR